MPRVVDTVLCSIDLLELDFDLPLSSSSFRSSDERLLLNVLVALLAVTHEDFRKDIALIWPYRDAQQKNQCKKKILDHLQRLVEAGEIPREYVKTTTLSIAKGPAAWDLLWKVSDAALRANMSSSSEAPVSSPDSDLASIVSCAKSNIAKIQEHSKGVIKKQHELSLYSSELGQRFKQATDDIDKLTDRLQRFETRRSQALDEGFNIGCEDILKRLQSFSNMLEYLEFKKLQIVCTNENKLDGDKKLQQSIDSYFQRSNVDPRSDLSHVIFSLSNDMKNLAEYSKKRNQTIEADVERSREVTRDSLRASKESMERITKKLIEANDAKGEGTSP